jgi:hypothetical protein
MKHRSPAGLRAIAVHIGNLSEDRFRRRLATALFLAACRGILEGIGAGAILAAALYFLR